MSDIAHPQKQKINKIQLPDLKSQKLPYSIKMEIQMITFFEQAMESNKRELRIVEYSESLSFTFNFIFKTKHILHLSQ